MNAEAPVNNPDDKFIQQILQKIGQKYGPCEALRGQWVVTFIYEKDGVKRKTKLKKPVITEHRIKNKIPQSIKNLLR